MKLDTLAKGFWMMLFRGDLTGDSAGRTHIELVDVRSYEVRVPDGSRRVREYASRLATPIGEKESTIFSASRYVLPKLMASGGPIILPRSNIAVYTPEASPLLLSLVLSTASI